MLKARHAASVLLSLLPLINLAYAQSGSVEDCRTIPDRLARYTCYDRYESGVPVSSSAASTRSNTTTSTSNTSSVRVQEREERSGLPIIGRLFDRDDNEVEAPAVTTAPVSEASDVDSFGLENPADDSRVIEGSDGKELIADIAALEERSRNLWLITLANGQTWVQMESKPYRLQVGDSVRIYPTRWGSSYRLTSDRVSGYIQVRRIGASGPAVSSSPAPETFTPAATATTSTESASTNSAEEERSGLPIIGRFFNRDRDAEEEQDEEDAPEVTSASEVDSFGRENPDEEARVIEGTEGKELIADIAALEERGRNLWIITLANGQRWVQMESKPYRLQVGDSVRIYPTRWGNSYRLTSERVSGYIQVRRTD